MRNLAVALALALAAACSSKGPAGGSDAPVGSGGPDAAVEDLDMKPSDFECVLRWTQVNNAYRITNRLGHDALSVANDPNGGTFPVGTIIQIVPTEAMVKRRAGFSAQTHDWEFFSLTVAASGTTIDARGTTNVVNAFGGNCLACHMKAMPQYDFVCGTTHGCAPLPLTTQQLVNVQNSDPRCP
jgi:hypothetical protein